MCIYTYIQAGTKLEPSWTQAGTELEPSWNPDLLCQDLLGRLQRVDGALRIVELALRLTFRASWNRAGTQLEPSWNHPRWNRAGDCSGLAGD